MTRARAAVSIVFAVLWLGGIASFFAYDALPFMDLPAQAGLIALRERLGHSPFEDRFYVLDAHLGPYSLFRWLGGLLGRVFGPVQAVRILGAAGPSVMPFALACAQRRAFGTVDTSVLFLGIALSYGLMTIFGFASYILALACFVVVLGEALRWSNQEGAPSARDRASLASGLLLLFVAHGHAYLLGLGALAWLTARQRNTRLAALVSALPSLVLATYATVAAQNAGGPSAPHIEPHVHFLGPLDKLSLLVTPTLTTRLGVDIAAGLVVWGVLIAGFLASRRHSSNRLTVSKVNYLVVACAALFLISPHDVGWFGFADGRIVLATALVIAASSDPGALSAQLHKWRLRLSIVAAALIVVCLHVASRGFQSEASGYREALAHVAPARRLFYIPLDADSRWFTGHPFLHYDKFVLVAQPQVVSDLWFHQGTAVYPRAALPQVPMPSLQPGDRPLLERLRVDEWDYVLVKTASDASLPQVPRGARLAFSDNGWWLFTVEHSPTRTD